MFVHTVQSILPSLYAKIVHKNLFNMLVHLGSCTGKLVYKDHPWDQKKCGPYTQVIFIYRFNNMESIPLGTCKMWSLYTGGPYIEVVFRAVDSIEVADITCTS